MCSIQMMVDSAAVDFPDGFDQFEAFALGQAAGDLVEQQQVGIGGKRARHLEPLAFEQGERAGERVGARDQVQPLEDFGTWRGGGALGEAAAMHRRRPAGSRTP